MPRDSKESKERKAPSRESGKRAAGPPDVSAANYRFAIAAARFNSDVVDRLLEGALAALDAKGAPRASVAVVRTPGAFDLPLAARRLAESGQYDAVIALGCVVRGETSHFEHVSRVAADGVARVALDTGVPVTFGVLTTDTVRQALARAGGEAGNIGADAALAALEMAALMRRL